MLRGKYQLVAMAESVYQDVLNSTSLFRIAFSRSRWLEVALKSVGLVRYLVVARVLS